MSVLQENKLKHCATVAQFMYEHAKESEKDEMYTLGLLHDIGYLHTVKEHNKVGGMPLRDQNYKYWREVLNHGSTKSSYCSEALDLLNWADMPVDHLGKLVGFTARLEDIRNRYGENSSQYESAIIIVNKLKEKGYYDVVEVGDKNE